MASRVLRRGSALAAALALAGCASLAPPDAALAELPQATWANAASAPGSAPPRAADGVPATDLAAWWQRFGDAELAALVERGIVRHTSVRSAQAALERSRALADAAAASLAPTLGLGVSAGASTRGGSAGRTTRQSGASLDASWEPDLFGGLGATRDAAAADARAAYYTLADARVSLAGEVALAYIDWRSAQAREAIAARNLALQDDTLQIARWRVQAGLASSLDAEQATAAAAQTRAQRTALAAAVAQSAQRLALLGGDAPGAAARVLPAASAPVPLPPEALVLAFPADTLSQRPDVRAAVARVDAARADVLAADAERMPSLRLSGSIGLSTLALGAVSGGDALLGSLLASVGLPLFDGGARDARLRAGSAGWQQARIAYEAAVLQALQEVEDALVALGADRERMAQLQVALDAARAAELLARQRYESGLIDFRTVLDAQRSLLSSEDGVQTARASLAADHVRLYKALGGGWDAQAPDATPTAPSTSAAAATSVSTSASTPPARTPP